MAKKSAEYTADDQILDNLFWINGSKLVSGEVDLDEVAQAFAGLADPDRHVKNLVRPDL